MLKKQKKKERKEMKRKETQGSQRAGQRVEKGVEKHSESEKAHHFNTISLSFNDRQREGYHRQFNKASLLEQLSLKSTA